LRIALSDSYQQCLDSTQSVPSHFVAMNSTRARARDEELLLHLRAVVIRQVRAGLLEAKAARSSSLSVLCSKHVSPIIVMPSNDAPSDREKPKSWLPTTGARSSPTIDSASGRAKASKRCPSSKRRCVLASTSGRRPVAYSRSKSARVR
jgi:hypothetical protein